MSHQSLTPQQQAELTEIFELTQVTSQQMKELCEQAEAFDRKLERIHKDDPQASYILLGNGDK